MDEKYHDEKDEKEYEKREEKSSNDLVNGVIGAGMVIWAGVVLLANNVGFLDVFTSALDRLSIPHYDLPFDIPFISPRALQVFFLGAAALLLIEVIIRLIAPYYRRGILGTLIVAIVFIALALGEWTFIGPAILIAIGLSILVGAMGRRRR